MHQKGKSNIEAVFQMHYQVKNIVEKIRVSREAQQSKLTQPYWKSLYHTTPIPETWEEEVSEDDGSEHPNCSQKCNTKNRPPICMKEG